jgi:lanosterol synthase
VHSTFRASMARTRSSYATDGALKTTTNKAGDQKTDLTRWRLLDDRGRQTWHYLNSDEEVKKWPQSTADKWYLGLDTVREYFCLGSGVFS